MSNVLNWLRRQTSNPQVVFLALSLVVIILIISFAGNTLAPVIASIVIAYLLEGIIGRLAGLGMPRLFCVCLVFLAFMLSIIGITFGLLPILYNQMSEIVQQIPSIIARGQTALMALPEQYPELISVEQARDIIDQIRIQLTDFGQALLSGFITGAASIITIMIYVILMPILVFFFTKDKDKILSWFIGFLPKDHELASRIWGDVDAQIANYIRGKFWEILIVWTVTLAAFSFLGLQFAMLLSFLVGISVLIPYVGAAVVTLPVAVIAWFQWGWSSEFITLLASYLVIQALDGNLLVPVLFSEVVNLHPVAIIVAILAFGSLWGIWGIFFAIPLATLVQAIIVAWPTPPSEASDQPV